MRINVEWLHKVQGEAKTKLLQYMAAFGANTWHIADAYEKRVMSSRDFPFIAIWKKGKFLGHVMFQQLEYLEHAFPDMKIKQPGKLFLFEINIHSEITNSKRLREYVRKRFIDKAIEYANKNRLRIEISNRRWTWNPEELRKTIEDLKKYEKNRQHPKLHEKLPAYKLMAKNIAHKLKGKKTKVKMPREWPPKPKVNGHTHLRMRGK